MACRNLKEKVHTNKFAVAVLVVLFHTNFWLVEGDKTSMFQDRSRSTKGDTILTGKALLSGRSLQEVTTIQQIPAVLVVLVEQQLHPSWPCYILLLHMKYAHFYILVVLILLMGP